MPFDKASTLVYLTVITSSSSCCDCTGCSVSISGVGTKEINTSTTLSASASGFSATGYQWSKSTNNSSFTNQYPPNNNIHKKNQKILR